MEPHLEGFTPNIFRDLPRLSTIRSDVSMFQRSDVQSAGAKDIYVYEENWYPSFNVSTKSMDF